VNTKTHLVRLLAGVAVSVASCFFVTAYSRLSLFRYGHEQPDGHLIRATEFLLQWAWVGYAVPAVALLLGIWALRRNAASPVLFEVIIAGTWFLALVWFGQCLLFWQAQNLRIINHI
jgi:hypothetical protein